MYRSNVLVCLGAIMMLVSSAWAAPQDGDATVHIGPIQWTKDSIGYFVMPDAANVLFLASKPDSAVLVVDPKTGAERQRLRGYIQDQTSIKCSPDGTLLLMGGGHLDGRTATLLYSSEGQLVRQWDEQSEAWAISAKLQRACVLMKNGNAPGCALRDLTTGETIRWLDGWEYVWFDEWHNRLYVGTGKWGGEFAKWTVELDATTGEVLNKWGLETYGPMCRLKDSDTLLVIGEDARRPGFQQAKVLALNVRHGGRGPVVNCPEGVTDGCLCIGWNVAIRMTLNAEGTRIMLHRLRSNIDESIVARRFSNQAGTSECYLNDKTFSPSGQPIALMTEFVDDVNNSYYYLPNGARDGFFCRSIGPTLPVPEPGAPTPLTMIVDGSTLRISPATDLAGDGILSITDMSGRLVQRLTVSVDGRPISVSIAGLPAGNYLCSLQAGSMTSTGKFSVVQ